MQSSKVHICHILWRKRTWQSKLLTDFVSECKSLIKSGTSYTMHLLQFKTHAIISDALARSFIKTVQGQASYSACERCTVPGVWNEKMTFPEFNAVKQMDVAFDEMQDADHHNSPSPMSELGIGMVSQFVIVDFQTRLKAKCVSDPTERLNVSSAGTQQYIKLLSHNRVSILFSLTTVCCEPARPRSASIAFVPVQKYSIRISQSHWCRV